MIRDTRYITDLSENSELATTVFFSDEGLVNWLHMIRETAPLATDYTYYNISWSFLRMY